jgi:hypothetical protein
MEELMVGQLRRGMSCNDLVADLDQSNALTSGGWLCYTTKITDCLVHGDMEFQQSGTSIRWTDDQTIS